MLFSTLGMSLSKIGRRLLEPPGVQASESALVTETEEVLKQRQRSTNHSMFHPQGGSLPEIERRMLSTAPLPAVPLGVAGLLGGC